jgi:hypothetical protein
LLDANETPKIRCDPAGKCCGKLQTSMAGLLVRCVSSTYAERHATCCCCYTCVWAEEGCGPHLRGNTSSSAGHLASTSATSAAVNPSTLDRLTMRAANWLVLSDSSCGCSVKRKRHSCSASCPLVLDCRALARSATAAATRSNA